MKATYYCNRCSAPFEAHSNRQRFCSEECRLAHRTDDRRQWRRAVADLKREPPSEDEMDFRRNRSPSTFLVQFRDLSAEEVAMLSLHSERKTWADDRDLFSKEGGSSLENVSNMSSVSERQAWQLDSRALKARQRMANHFPPVVTVKRGKGQPDLLVFQYDHTIDELVCIPYEHAANYVGEARESALADERQALGEAA